MRKVIVHRSGSVTVEIESPWLGVKDAATYLGISRSEFNKLSYSIPARKKIGEKSRRYHVQDLDEFASGIRREDK